jgi:ABC-type antimicrobial peptide transport system permease subunit
MAFSLEQYLEGQSDVYMLVIAILASVTLSILYAWIIINYRRMEIATLKCIGWTNGDIRTLIVGEIVWVSTIAFIIVGEILIHFAAAMNYYTYQNFVTGISVEEYRQMVRPLLQIWNVVYTAIIFLTAQVIGILLMYNKILKLRPIVALRHLK